MATSLFIITLLLLQLSTFSSSLLLIPLTHSLSKTNTTTTHLLKSTSSRSAARFRRVSLPLNPGSDYTLSLTLGSQTISLYMDTGSDVVWLPCRPFSCILCDDKITTTPLLLNLSSSASPITCQSRACSSAHSSQPSSDLCAAANCPLDQIETSDCKKFNCPPFYYAYGDGSFVANLYSDRLSFPLSNPPFEIKNFNFGCAHSTLAEPIGVAGFGRGSLSFPAQLATSSPEMGNYFSYCLVSHSFNPTRVRIPSPLILGRYAEDEEKSESDGLERRGFVYTPLLKNPKHSYFYSVGLDAVSIGRRRLPAPEKLRRVDAGGDGGMVVDSGTTYTMLPKKFYDDVVGEFDARVGSVYKRAGDVEGRTGLGPCYYLGSGSSVVVPRMVLHFGGNSSVVMPRRNYFYEFLDGGDGGKGRKVGCVMVMNGGDDMEEGGGGPAGLLGNYQQQGFEVVYDLEKGRVGFARRKCASLWESLNRH